MSRWWRAYDEAVDDPKLQTLHPELFRAWFNICCITSQNGGKLPELDAIAFKLRTTAPKAHKTLGELRLAGLLDDDGEGGIAPHNWDARQFKSDVTDPTNATRQKRFRDRNRNGPNTVTPTVTVTPTRDRAETEQIEDTASAVPQIAFESGIIRLNAKDLSKWKKAYCNLELEAELLSLTEWAGTQGNHWFHAVMGALAKRNRAVGLQRTAVQKNTPLTPSGNLWPEGIT